MSNERPSAARIGALGFLVVAFLCAAFAAFMVSRVLKSKGYAGERVVPIVIAVRALPAAEPIPEDALKVVNWPEGSVPPGAVSDPKELWQDGKAPIPSDGILPGEPVTTSRLAAKTMGTMLAALVQPGMRAVVIKARDAVGRSGLVYPGARVDVLATIRDPEGRGPSAKIAVQNARVLAVELETDVVTRRPRTTDESGTLSSSSSDSSTDGTVITIEVAPADAEILALAEREGSVDLALRNASDSATVETVGSTPFDFSAYAPLTAEDGSLIDPTAPPVAGVKAGKGATPKTPTTGSKTRDRGLQLQAKEPAGQPIESYQGGR